jgi:hypothetical protein
MKISPWIYIEDAAVRILAGSDIEKISNRVAFIEKTPRVRIRNGGMHSDFPDFLNWCEGYKGEGPLDPISQAWCDTMLVALGYELT